MATNNASEEEDDDYLTMSFTEPAPQTSRGETSLQRRQRLQREGQLRGAIKSKAQLAAEAAQQRDEALATSLLDGPAAKKSKGLSMMAKMGFKGGALGRRDESSSTGQNVEPIKLNVKSDRGGIGLESERKRKLEEVSQANAAKRPQPKPIDPLEFRDRVRREREVARLEKQVYAAQRIAERMDEEKREAALAETASGTIPQGAAPAGTKEARRKQEETKERTIPSRPLKAVPVLWRGQVKHREQAERDRRMRHDLEVHLSSSTRLPTYNPDDDEEDDDDRRALGKDKKTVYVVADDLDDEDPELDEFEALEWEEKLRLLTEHLRKEYYYCFWCKFRYEDETMEGCPGLTEEEHD